MKNHTDHIAIRDSLNTLEDIMCLIDMSATEPLTDDELRSMYTDIATAVNTIKSVTGVTTEADIEALMFPKKEIN
jgi:hypothetical protein